ncbi:tripartite tricarboxylate transporter substrate binding protein [Siccirubricoccus sp. KC 17139]|uniref:Tripartite tricarboxylate transporter substrate binding protein n=1 Tax=Siccirubricoccus soli TaxID=2899147 RepID=A0ABT1D630_9PROT|nr:tripartite tricarboxylate transporter substrate binding protein [Siccirubricoccus soli]MCO6417383.1 tripartite tricarboxylate transporter substrate binding protein [Siccirubricoccus soli]MCP2683518.1 tripartite tricarboxylate transporter substrate binding protein [Siccirubricoccus soli]
MRRILLGALLALPAILPGAAPAAAQDAFPSRPIRLVVPFATGGPSDIVARVLAPKMTAVLGQAVVVEARPGAGGVTGMDAVAKAAPDGYTFGLGSAGGLAISPSLQPSMPYQVARDFAPLSLAVIVNEPLVVPASMPWRNLAELLADARARPGALNYGSTGPGSMPHLAGELMKLTAKVDITHVPYRGGAPLSTALVAGEVQIGFADLPILLPHIRAGTMRALAIGSAQRYPLLPEVPTFAEAGLQGVTADNWHGFVAPARTPPAVLAALHRAVVAALTDPENVRLLNEQGAIPSPQSQEEFATFIARETERWGEVIRRAGVKPD